MHLSMPHYIISLILLNFQKLSECIRNRFQLSSRFGVFQRFFFHPLVAYFTWKNLLSVIRRQLKSPKSTGCLDGQNISARAYSFNLCIHKNPLARIDLSSESLHSAMKLP